MRKSAPGKKRAFKKEPVKKEPLSKLQKMNKKPENQDVKQLKSASAEGTNIFTGINKLNFGIADVKSMDEGYTMDTDTSTIKESPKNASNEGPSMEERKKSKEFKRSLSKQVPDQMEDENINIDQSKLQTQKSVEEKPKLKPLYGTSHEVAKTLFENFAETDDPKSKEEDPKSKEEDPKPKEDNIIHIPLKGPLPEELQNRNIEAIKTENMNNHNSPDYVYIPLRTPGKEDIMSVKSESSIQTVQEKEVNKRTEGNRLSIPQMEEDNFSIDSLEVNKKGSPMKMVQPEKEIVVKDVGKTIEEEKKASIVSDKSLEESKKNEEESYVSKDLFDKTITIDRETLRMKSVDENQDRNESPEIKKSKESKSAESVDKSKEGAEKMSNKSIEEKDKPKEDKDKSEVDKNKAENKLEKTKTKSAKEDSLDKVKDQKKTKSAVNSKEADKSLDETKVINKSVDQNKPEVKNEPIKKDKLIKEDDAKPVVEKDTKVQAKDSVDKSKEEDKSKEKSKLQKTDSKANEKEKETKVKKLEKKSSKSADLGKDSQKSNEVEKKQTKSAKEIKIDDKPKATKLGKDKSKTLDENKDDVKNKELKVVGKGQSSLKDKQVDEKSKSIDNKQKIQPESMEKIGKDKQKSIEEMIEKKDIISVEEGVKKELDEDAAATKIQSSWRGHNERRKRDVLDKNTSLNKASTVGKSAEELSNSTINTVIGKQDTVINNKDSLVAKSFEENLKMVDKSLERQKSEDKTKVTDKTVEKEMSSDVKPDEMSEQDILKVGKPILTKMDHVKSNEMSGYEEDDFETYVDTDEEKEARKLSAKQKITKTDDIIKEADNKLSKTKSDTMYNVNSIEDESVRSKTDEKSLKENDKRVKDDKSVKYNKLVKEETNIKVDKKVEHDSMPPKGLMSQKSEEPTKNLAPPPVNRSKSSPEYIHIPLRTPSAEKKDKIPSSDISRSSSANIIPSGTLSAEKNPENKTPTSDISRSSSGRDIPKVIEPNEKAAPSKLEESLKVINIPKEATIENDSLIIVDTDELKNKTNIMKDMKMKRNQELRVEEPLSDSTSLGRSSENLSSLGNRSAEIVRSGGTDKSASSGKSKSSSKHRIQTPKSMEIPTSVIQAAVKIQSLWRGFKIRREKLEAYEVCFYFI